MPGSTLLPPSSSESGRASSSPPLMALSERSVTHNMTVAITNLTNATSASTSQRGIVCSMLLPPRALVTWGRISRFAVARERMSCDDVRMHRRVSGFGSLVILVVLGLAAPALASRSGAVLWTALGGDVTCGIAIHPPNTPPIRMLCSATTVPAPKAKGFGDPGFVFFGSIGHPELARLSQNTFVGTSPVALKAGSSWRGGPIDATCTIRAKAVRCVNRSHHGFTITKTSYKAF